MEKRRVLIFAIIFFLGVGLRIGYFYFNHYNMDLGDDEPWSKINLAIRWIYSESFAPDLNFGPLHTYIISSLWLLDKENFIILSRIISLVFGILFIGLYFCLIKELFNIKVAYFSAFLVSIYPLHIHLSSVSLAEVPAHFLLFTSLYFLYRFINYKKFFYLIISATALNLSCMLRFENWLFVFLFTGILFLKFRFSRYVYVFFTLSCIFPFIWMIVNYKYEGNPINFVKTSSIATNLMMQYVNLEHKASGFIYILYKGLSLPIFICCSLGFILSLLKGLRNNAFIIFFSFLFFVYELRSIQGSYSYFTWRYSVLLGLLFLPFGGIALRYILENINLSRYIRSLVIMFMLLFCFLYSIKTLKFFYKNTVISNRLIDAISWIRANVTRDERVLLEYGVYHPLISLNSHLHPEQVVNYNHLALYKNRNLEKYQGDFDYIVISKCQGLFRYSVSNLITTNRIVRVFNNEEWQIFKLKK